MELGVAKSETALEATRRHLRNGYVILTERGLVALYGAAMREAAKIIDSPVGSFLAPRDILRDGPDLLRSQGWRACAGAVLRQIAAEYDPPLGRSRNPVNAVAREGAVRHLYTYELTKPDGVVPARRPANDVDCALETPFAYAPSPKTERVAAIIHAFYPDAMEGVLQRLAHLPCAVDLFLSTDTQDKRDALARACAGWTKGTTNLRVLPNRGRDIAAKFIGFRDVYDAYDVFLHLHTKKSPHGGTPLARWRDYLLDNLIGAPDIAASNLSLFDDPKIGVVFPQHLFELRGILNWGYDYPQARALMARMGQSIDKNLTLDFPSGSMFFARSAAIRPLLDLHLTYDDFQAEAGQVDGTLAHAIERIILMTAETAGFEWLKVVRRDLYPLGRTVLPVRAPADLARLRPKVFQPCLTPVDVETPPYARMLKEIRPIAAYPSRNLRPRVTLLVPSVNPQHVFGGAATALKLFEEWCDRLGPDYDRRIVTSDAEIEPAGYASLSRYTPTPFVAGSDETQPSGWALVDASERFGGRLDVRAREVFIATAWWTANFARAFERERARFHGARRSFVYLIQDDEPFFYGWGSKFAMAEASYSGHDFLAVVNSEELYAAAAKYAFQESYCLPYALNARVAQALRPRPRERLILVYGRPAVFRNAFEAICEGIKCWQQRDPVRASRWRVLFLGEAFDLPLAYPVQNAAVEGKVSLEAYADYLSRAAVGVSLMVSPHPSYPPLEMAQAGLTTITNAYSGKDLRRRFPDIVQLEAISTELLAQALEAAVEKSEPRIGTIVPQNHPLPLDLPGPLADPDIIAGRLAQMMA
jgi:hypothetical protein